MRRVWPSSPRGLVLVGLLAVGLAGCAGENERLARATALHPGGRQTYEQYNCIRCHSAGEGGYGPRMIDNTRLADLEYIKGRIRNGASVGGAVMPPFPNIRGEELEELAQFVRALAEGK
jgi:mono/diheme cytochrome c family protein